ncbi:polysaccharide deacetylase family protein [Desmospora profundinema]|uniref:Peptidoglycan/xylan/chitin deacetylase (PgdA/CDA1 family) n=1 Tax=Desmospora profundinema TaxID=1571184 RepID=A0ABU1IQT0_9BACL|nr:polysaccharide deacetylase family protein [Desmospora profundinema]MDR6226897.1 peptidoglycan/xylan/chitin deacetylase (PgdA/CDA1 family) [Desmospora profundinema]
MSGVFRWGGTLLGVFALAFGFWMIFPFSSDTLVEGQKGGNEEAVEERDPPLAAQIATEQLKKKPQDQAELDPVSPIQKRVALTFDDGPDGQFTPEIMDILKREGAPATFFVVGQMVRGYPEMVKRMDEEGHVVANHTWSHSDLTRLSKKQIQKELIATNRAVEQVIGKKMRLMRPPYGAISGKEATVEQAGWELVMWDVDTWDWKQGKKPSEIRRSVREGVKPDSIVLLHSAGGDREATVRALPGIIRDLKRSGYHLVTVDEILGLDPYKLER